MATIAERKAMLVQKQRFGVTRMDGVTPLQGTPSQRVFDKTSGGKRRDTSARSRCKLCGNPSRKLLCVTCGGTDEPIKSNPNAKREPIVQVGVVGKARAQGMIIASALRDAGVTELTQASVAALKRNSETWARQRNIPQGYEEIFCTQLIDFVGMYL